MENLFEISFNDFAINTANENNINKEYSKITSKIISSESKNIDDLIKSMNNYMYDNDSMSNENETSTSNKDTNELTFWQKFVKLLKTIWEKIAKVFNAIMKWFERLFKGELFKKQVPKQIEEAQEIIQTIEKNQNNKTWFENFITNMKIKIAMDNFLHRYDVLRSRRIKKLKEYISLFEKLFTKKPEVKAIEYDKIRADIDASIKEVGNIKLSRESLELSEEILAEELKGQVDWKDGAKNNAINAKYTVIKDNNKSFNKTSKKNQSYNSSNNNNSNINKSNYSGSNDNNKNTITPNKKQKLKTATDNIYKKYLKKHESKLYNDNSQLKYLDKIYNFQFINFRKDKTDLDIEKLKKQVKDLKKDMNKVYVNKKELKDCLDKLKIVLVESKNIIKDINEVKNFESVKNLKGYFNDFLWRMKVITKNFNEKTLSEDLVSTITLGIAQKKSYQNKLFFVNQQLMKNFIKAFTENVNLLKKSVMKYMKLCTSYIKFLDSIDELNEIFKEEFVNSINKES